MFRNPCDLFGCTYKLTLRNWALVVFTFVAFAINHTSNYPVPMTEDTLLPRKPEVVLLIKQKISHKMENASGDQWYAPVFFMLEIDPGTGEKLSATQETKYWGSH